MPLRMRISTAFLTLTTLLSLTSCQSLSNWAIGQISPIAWNGEDVIELPITPTMWGSPTVPIFVSGHETPALVDSGASLPVMSRGLAVATGARTRASGPKVNGKRRETADDVLVQIGSASSKLGFVVIDDHASGDRQMSLGADLFHQAVVDMDFDAQRLRIINPKSFNPPTQAPLQVNLLMGVPTVQLKLNGHNSEVCAVVDTGYNSGLAVTPEVAKALSLPVDPSGRRLVARAAFGQQYEQPALAPLTEVRLGEFIYRDVQVGHAPPEKEKCVNLVGMAVLSQHRIIFDLQRRRLWLLPRSGLQ